MYVGPIAIAPAALLSLATLAACGSSSPPAFVRTAQQSKALTIYEGVPRDTSMQSTAPTMKIASETFYSAKHTVEGSQADAIAKLLADDSTYRSHVEEKKCGGFHADFAVEWDGEKGKRQVLLCFGCGEARSIGDGADTTVDLTQDGEDRLEKVLYPVVKK